MAASAEGESPSGGAGKEVFPRGVVRRRIARKSLAYQGIGFARASGTVMLAEKIRGVKNYALPVWYRVCRKYSKHLAEEGADYRWVLRHAWHTMRASAQIVTGSIGRLSDETCRVLQHTAVTTLGGGPILHRGIFISTQRGVVMAKAGTLTRTVKGSATAEWPWGASRPRPPPVTASATRRAHARRRARREART
jgi:hypothetical protein